jgi:hypothetical protein
MRIRVCYLDCHEAGLCCYLVIRIQTVICPLQLFYFHLWPIYWLFLAPSPDERWRKWSISRKDNRQKEAKVLRVNVPQNRYVRHKFHIHVYWPGIEPGPPQWEADDCLPQLWYGPHISTNYRIYTSALSYMFVGRYFTKLRNNFTMLW